MGELLCYAPTNTLVLHAGDWCYRCKWNDKTYYMHQSKAVSLPSRRKPTIWKWKLISWDPTAHDKPVMEARQREPPTFVSNPSEVKEWGNYGIDLIPPEEASPPPFVPPFVEKAGVACAGSDS